MASSLLTAGPGLVTIAGILLLGPRALRHWLDARQDVTLDELRRRPLTRDPLTSAVRIAGPYANEPARGNGPARDTLAEDLAKGPGARGTE